MLRVTSRSWRALRAIAFVSLLVPSVVAHSQTYPYRRVPRILYIVGQPKWDDLPQGNGQSRNLTVYSTMDEAQAAAGGRQIFRVQRNTLDAGAAEADGKAFMDRLQNGSEFLKTTMSFSSPAALDAVVVRAKTGNNLGPNNPNWKLTGESKYEMKDMKAEHLPGMPRDDYDAGTFYFPAEGSQAAVDFMLNYKVQYGKNAAGETILMRISPETGKLIPLETRGLSSDVKDHCLFVMDAEGNMFVVATEWVNILPLGYERVNHSSISAGHAVAAAGQLEVHDGKIVHINNGSGHFEPSNKMLAQAVHALETKHGVGKGYRVDFSKFAGDHPGKEYIVLDPDGEGKVKRGEIAALAPEAEVAKPNITETKHPVDESKLLKPEEPEPRADLDVKRRENAPHPEPAVHEAPKPVAPPDPAVVDAIREKIVKMDAANMDKKFMTEVYQMHGDAAKIVGQVLGEAGMSERNFKMGELRKQMDLEVWKKLLSDHKIQVEITNQGKANGARSDLDYTLYFLAEEGGVKIKDLIAEHSKVWEALHHVSAEKLEIKVMNGDEFYPDWRNESLSAAEHEVLIREMLGQLRLDHEKYSVPGANKEQVHNRPLLEGTTEFLKYDPALDKPEIPIEKQIVIDRGLTRDIALRYKGVHPQYNRMNALGNLIQNRGEYFSHSGDAVQDVIRRAKYFNRVINEGLGNLRFFANDYRRIMDSDLPNREEMKLEYLKKTLGLLADDNGKPLIEPQMLESFKKIIDISMQIELDKTGNRKGDKFAFDDSRAAELFKDYKTQAEANIDKQYEASEIKAGEKPKLILSEQQRLFEFDQRRVLAEAVLAGMRQSVARDLTPEGAFRNRVRFNPETQRFTIDDLEGSRKAAFERATEVALFYELVNSLDDRIPEQMFMKRDMKKRALSTAPTDELAEFYGSLDQVDKFAIDRFVAGDPNNHVQRKIDDLLEKQQKRAYELMVERKEKAIASMRARGISVEPSTVPPYAVRDRIVEARQWGLSPKARAEFSLAYKQLGTKVSGALKESFYENASGLMLGSSAVNLARAWQAGGGVWTPAVGFALFTEAINYMPNAIQMPFTALDMLSKVRKGQYEDAVWQGSLLSAMTFVPGLGHAMLGYNIVTGSVDIVHTHFVSRIDVDLAEQALKSRPVDASGRRLPENVRARGNRFPDASQSVYNGSGPGTPLFYGRYKNKEAREPVATIDGVTYSDGRVPHDSLTDEALADSATFQFAPVIDSTLTAQGLKPGTSEWARKAWELKQKFGFDIPFYRRMAKVFSEKYQYITYYQHWPSAYNKEYMEECRLDVYDWYVQQPPGYKDELAGEGRGLRIFFSDQTDKMEEKVAQQCALIMGSMKEAQQYAQIADSTNMRAFKEATARGFDAERALIAAGIAVRKRIQTDEEKAIAAVDKKALEIGEKYKPQLTVSYPFTYATEEHPPVLQFSTRTLQPRKAGTDTIEVNEQVLDYKEGAPSGWKPGKAAEYKFKPDSTGFVPYRPVTVSMKFTARLLNSEKKELAKGTLELPIVAYEPTFSGSVTVVVYALSAKGDSNTYGGATVTLGNLTQSSDALNGTATFGRLKEGPISVKVAPPKSDERHGPGSGSGTISDMLFSKDKNGKEHARIVVKLPYIPEKVVAVVDTAKKTDKNGLGGADNSKKPTGNGGKQGDDSTGTGNNPKNPNGLTTAADAISKLAPLTAKAEKARDDAKAACKYVEAAAAQEQLVAAAKSFIASTFPNGSPPEVAKLATGYDAELAALKKAATAEVAAKDKLREGLAFIRAKKGEPALSSLEAAAAIPNVPSCLYDQIMQTYNELKADIEKRMTIIDKAADAANNKCDYASARQYGEQVEAIDPTLSWVVKELPRIKDLDKRQRSAQQLAKDAEAKAANADAAIAQGNAALGQSLFNEAVQLQTQAINVAPDCEKANYSNTLNALSTRKSTAGTPQIDQSLILLLDTSGSMSDNGKMDGAKSAATGAVKALGPTTEVALITYDGGCAGGWRVNQDFTTNRASVINAINALRPGGGTPTGPAIGFASNYMQKNAHSKSAQIILMTDGQNDCGSMTDAGNAVRQGAIPVRVDAVGFGVDPAGKAQTDLGEMVRAAGNGNTYSANNSTELIAVFRRAFIANQIKPNDPYVSGNAGTRLSELFAAAINFLKRNDYRGAVDQLKMATDQFPASPAAQFNASLAYEAAGQPLQALNHAEKYLQLAPNAFDAGAVRERVSQLQAEQNANPRAIYAPADCSTLYRWAQGEVRAVGSDAARKAKVYDIMTTAQRGDCAAAQKSMDAYVTQYGKRF